MKQILATLFLSASMTAGCYALDSLDGDIESIEGCCIYWPDEDKVESCAQDFVERGYCQNLKCTFPGHTLEIDACYSEHEREEQ